MLGTVLHYNRQRGFGFALPDDGGSDVFIHASQLPVEHRYLIEGDRVAFEPSERNGKPFARNVRLVEAIEGSATAVRS